MSINDLEREEIYNLRLQNVSDDMIADIQNERRELQQWKELQGIY